ncbi:VanW family protein [Dyella sp. S184]|uniref:VanW family protein n=1 Tax=Dyella sp. S184 TaxID=1641862 RepID=UPI00131AD389|nr:VanW family protein [Dyella sp. S184]
MTTQVRDVPSRLDAMWFWLRSRRLIVLQAWRNVFDRRLRRWAAGDALVDAPILAQLRTPLWNDGRPDEFMLVAGKVHNLRIAAKAFHAVEVPARACLSFWQQLGRPTARQGFVRGREIREGCVVPTLAGGLCQISNALAICAIQAGFELVERHGHSARIEDAGAHAEQVDATVFWNYVDLKIRAPKAWRLELELDASELVLTLRAEAAVEPSTLQSIPWAVALGKSALPTARGCNSCQETSCFRHQPRQQVMQGMTAWLLDTWTPELSAYLFDHGQAADLLLPLPPLWLRRWLALRRTGKVGWFPLKPSTGACVEHAGWTWLRRSWWLRRWARHAGRRQASVIDGQRWLAAAYARKLRPEHTHLVIDQGLLPYLHQYGALGGRTYEVLATTLPMYEIQRRLDLAHHSTKVGAAQAATLTDFRAEPDLLMAEIDAMRGARQVVTAHGEVAAHWRERFGLDVLQLPWILPSVKAHKPVTSTRLPLVVFPASAMARKGACELAEALRGLNCRLQVLGTPSDDLTLWQGIDVEYAGYASDWLMHADAVVLPAHVEHSPRAVLAAVAAGVSVIATPACGLQDLPGISTIPAGDVAALRAALLMTLAKRMPQPSETQFQL